ncbi:TPA: hypothetical protein ACVE29_000735 [Streptococcus pyogenes]|nr:hypothetical protein [Streptococcus pyogenes]HEQ6503584.1 hypothetical protein [Streptococcus pyogenes]
MKAWTFASILIAVGSYYTVTATTSPASEHLLLFYTRPTMARLLATNGK